MQNVAPDPVARDINRLAPWFHNLHLPSGHETAPDHPLGDFPRVKWWELASSLPDDLSGWRALDVGCNAGFYSFALARRGADVLAIDSDEHYLRQARWATERFELADRVRFERLQVYELARRNERFDLVLFLGVLYHLRHPLLALDLLAEKVDRLLVLQTLTMPGEDELRPPADLPFDSREQLLDPRWPKMAFLEHRFADDPTNWWAPSHACVEAMLRSSGLEIVERPGYQLWVCRPHGLPSSVRGELDAASGRGD
ncbi:MAG: TIGR04290 family methyltransferase [Actinobacteria bacterium]|nr:TIGR04290 family methyltransferase [Actinomycetota bacterium]